VTMDYCWAVVPGPDSTSSLSEVVPIESREQSSVTVTGTVLFKVDGSEANGFAQSCELDLLLLAGGGTGRF